MSWLSSATGVGINPFGKDKLKIDPKKAAMTALTVGSFGGLGAIPGVARAAGVLGKVPGVAKAGSLLGKVPGVAKAGNFVLNGFGKAGQMPNLPPGGPQVSITGGNGLEGQPINYESGGGGDGGGWLDTLGKFAGKPGVLEAGANVVGGVLKGQSDAARLKQEQQQFERTQGAGEATNALAAERQRAAAPLRDQALFMLQQRMGVPNEQFKPHDIYNESYGSGPAQLGGQDPEELKRRAAMYKPGAGGVNQALYDAYIKKYGAMR